MTEHEWAVIAGLLEEWWPGDFPVKAEQAWFTAVETLDAEAVTAALRVFLLRGTRFRPSVSELLAELRSDPSQPTFDEACQLIFGHVLKARTTVRKSWWEPGEREQLNDQAAIAAAEQLHPYIGAFIHRQGLKRLRQLDIHDPEWGAARRKQLEAAWDEFVEVADAREIAVLVSGRRGELVQLDPLATLGIGRRQLDPGEA